MIFQKVGDVTKAQGINWEYEKIGSLVKFKQTGKVESLRKVKTFIKECNKLLEGENEISFVEEE